MPERHWRLAAVLLVPLLSLSAPGFCAEAEATAATDNSAGDAAAGEPPDTGLQQNGDGGFTFPPEVEALLNRAANSEDYTETERCITNRDIRNTEILDDQHLVFEMSGNRYFLVQFNYVCPGLRRGASLVYETRMGRLCRLDQIRAFQPGPAIPNPPCTVPGFMPVEKEQVALLRDSLKAKKKAEIDAYKAEKARKKQDKQS